MLRPYCTTAVLVGFILVIAASPSRAQGPAVRFPEAAQPVAPRSAPKEKQKHREGSRLEDVRGRFDFAGERMAFYPTGESESFRVLENLALERIWQATQDSNRKDEWIVSGTVTEYRGSNFLLVTKAVIRSQDAKNGLAP